ncbi:hypothetical protein B0J13DRAFT_530989 [Dactylonectria estremocensis]|uniref:Extracellular membrane protein CFEM domain-containing protein n=1 Tax=Dactylonectria estremocensis TaxID=1079267 RepID=A0A9P9DXT7_9HYPO|nr:hypothetical protein B0J13DRAFT_530989 [Dactylonectria estremocensis]
MLLLTLVVLAVLALPSTCLSPRQTLPDAAIVPSFCGPMPLEIYNKFSALKEGCICFANVEYDACNENAFGNNRPDDSIICGVRQCQNYNLCELLNPCAQTAPPGLQVLNCSTTEKSYPQLSTGSWGHDTAPPDAVATCVAFVAAEAAGIDEFGFARGFLLVADSLAKSSVNVGKGP